MKDSLDTNNKVKANKVFAITEMMSLKTFIYKKPADYSKHNGIEFHSEGATNGKFTIDEAKAVIQNFQLQKL